MTIANLGTLSLVASATPALTLAGMTEAGIDPKLSALIEAADGQVDPTYAAVMDQAPTLSMTTRHIAVALAACGIAGVAVVDLKAYFQQINPYGTRKTGATHLKLAVADGLLVPRTLSAAMNQPATLGLECHAISNGTTAPVILTPNTALPAGGGLSEAFVVGPCSINGTSFAIVSLTIDFGLAVKVEGSDGQVFPSLPYIDARRPVIRVTTLDSLAINTIGLSGMAQGATDSVFYLRKIARGGTRVADATAEHVSFTVDDGLIWCGPITSSQGQRIGTEIICQPISDGANAIIVIDTATAIT